MDVHVQIEAEHHLNVKDLFKHCQDTWLSQQTATLRVKCKQLCCISGIIQVQKSTWFDRNGWNLCSLKFGWCQDPTASTLYIPLRWTCYFVNLAVNPHAKLTCIQPLPITAKHWWFPLTRNEYFKFGVKNKMQIKRGTSDSFEQGNLAWNEACMPEEIIPQNKISVT